MIPKIIHYCWFGGNPLPPLAIKCINSWKKYLPDYEIIEWNETNFNINIIPYTKEAYKAKKYAFVSDYARFWILYNYGGLYFDTDVEIIKPIDDIIDYGSFMGCENLPDKPIAVAAGLGIGSIVKHPFYKDILSYYEGINFFNENGSYNQTTVVEYITNLLINKGLKNSSSIQMLDNIIIYPSEYFCPLDYQTSKLTITSNTRSIHHYCASWQSKTQKMYKYVAYIIGNKRAHKLANFLKRNHIIK